MSTATNPHFKLRAKSRQDHKKYRLLDPDLEDMPLTPLPQHMLDSATSYLRRSGALDLGPMLGLTSVGVA